MEQAGTRPDGRCDVAFLDLHITEYHRNEAFLLVKCIRRYCVEWAGGHFGLGLTQIDLLLTKICTKMIFVTFSLSLTLTFNLWTTNLLPYLL